MSTQTIRPLIYADIDLNIIDGSAIWVTSIVETMSQDPVIKPTILLKRPIIRDVLVKSFSKYENVTIINPWSDDFKKMNLNLTQTAWQKTKRLTPEQACEIIDQLDLKNEFDLFLVRGYSLANEIAQNYTFSKRTWFYLTDFPQEKENVTQDDLRNIKAIFENGARLACQTPILIDYFKDLLQTNDEQKFIYLPPMVPNYDADKISFKNVNNHMIYAGKFAPYWKAPEMFEAFGELEDKSIKFVVIGDKFHNYPHTENYQERVSDVLEKNPNIIWKKGISRSEVQENIIKSDVGSSWRHPIMDESKELSTKVLEFGLYGKPVILNRNPLHEELFGVDYPLFVNSKEEFKEKVIIAFKDDSVYELAAKRVFAVSEKHMFKNITIYLKPFLLKMKEESTPLKGMDIRKYEKINLLFAGHDLKFAQMLIDYFSSNALFNVKLDQWEGHNVHDESQSKKCLQWADVIVAEWGLGNAVWYSKHKRSDQSLIVRMHLQEKNTPFPKKIKWKSVDKLIFIAPGLKAEMEEAFDFLPDEKIQIIYNLVNTEKLAKDKLPDSNFNIGLMGISPMRKRLDMALDIFEKLWKKDQRYTLYVKGHLPNEYPWLWRRDEERSYYEHAFKRINKMPWRDSVIFEGWGDVTEWYRKIQYVLSPSDFESFHLAVAEGMASKTLPIIRDWHGADQLYPTKYIFHSVDQATELVEQFQSLSTDEFEVELEAAQQHILQHYDKYKICKEWEDLILTYKGK